MIQTIVWLIKTCNKDLALQLVEIILTLNDTRRVYCDEVTNQNTATIHLMCLLFSPKDKQISQVLEQVYGTERAPAKELKKTADFC